MSKRISIAVEVQVEDTGEIKTTKKIQGGQDLPSGGLVHANYALFLEALRLECYVMLLSKLSLGENLEDITPQALNDQVSAHLMDSLNRLLPEVSRETLERTKYK